jgi:hypothetical protein
MREEINVQFHCQLTELEDLPYDFIGVTNITLNKFIQQTKK